MRTNGTRRIKTVCSEHCIGQHSATSQIFRDGFAPTVTESTVSYTLSNPRHRYFVRMNFAYCRCVSHLNV